MAGPDTLFGQVLDDKYRLDDVLGAGGMGVVFRAADLRLNRAVAVKLVYGTATRRGVAEQFRLEAQAVARLRHPHIVTVHDFGVAESVGAYLVMELLDGGEHGGYVDEPRDDARDAALHVTRAVRRRARRGRAVGRLLARRRALRGGRGAPAVRDRLGRRAHSRALARSGGAWATNERSTRRSRARG